MPAAPSGWRTAESHSGRRACGTFSSPPDQINSDNIKIFAKIAACSFGKALPAQRGGDPRARLQRVQPWALHEGHRLGDARDDQSAGRLLAALCHLSAATNLMVSPGSIFTSVGSNTILPRSEPLLSDLTSISAGAAKVATVSIAAAFRSRALCVVISCRLSSTNFDHIQDVKVTEEHEWRGPTNAGPCRDKFAPRP